MKWAWLRSGSRTPRRRASALTSLGYLIPASEDFLFADVPAQDARFIFFLFVPFVFYLILAAMTPFGRQRPETKVG